jgi:hypothetical protein
MGLDMYLSKHTYVGANYEHNNVTGNISIFVRGVEIPINFSRMSEIKEIVGYWRKANAIHAWFVRNVQNGVDDCGDYEVSADKLKELLETVNEVLKNPEKAKELLPAQEGFFFGSMDYDKWYFEDLKYTKKLLKDLINEDKQDVLGISWFEYHSSW